MQHITTLLTPSAALPGLLSHAYKAEKQLERYEKLLEKSAAMTATEANLDAAHRHFKAQAADALALLDNMEITDTPPMPTFKATLEQFGIEVSPPGKSEFWRVVEAAAKSAAVRRWTPGSRSKRMRRRNVSGFLSLTQSPMTPPSSPMR